MALERVVERGQGQALSRRLLDDRVEPVHALVPPVAEQFRVHRADADAARRDAPADERHEVLGVQRRLRERGGEIVWAAVVAPHTMVVRGEVVVIAIRPRGRVAPVAPHERHDLAVKRPQHRPLVGRDRMQVRGVAKPERVGQLDAGAAHARLLKGLVQPRSVRAFGQPEAAGPVAEATAMRRHAGLHLQRRAGVGGQQWQDRMRGGRRPRHVRRERLEQAAGQPLQAVGGGRVLGGRALELGDEQIGAPLAHQHDVAPVGLGANVAQERQAALGDARGLELIAQHRRQRQRDRRPPEHVEKRQIRRGDRLPQPLLAEWPRAEALDVGHVRVQDERELARLAGSWAHTRHIARKSSAASRFSARSAKSLVAIAGVNQS